MPVVKYIDLPQCNPTSRDEVTTVLSEVSENGVIRGRVMHDQPTYRLRLSHMGMSKDQYDQWNTWWALNFNNEIAIKWAADDNMYRGIFAESPSIEAIPYRSFNISVTLLVKQAVDVPVIAAPGTPGIFNPVAPETLADLIALGELGNTTAWTSGQYVVLLDNSEAYWDGSTWITGRAP